MNQDDLIELVRQAGGNATGQGMCPDDESLASYLEGGLSEADHRAFELHLADCDHCLALIGALGRAASYEDHASPASGRDLARARRIAGPQPAATSSGGRLSPRWAMAAVLLLSLGIAALSRGPQDAGIPVDFPAVSREQPVRSMRSIDPAAPLSGQPAAGEDLGITAEEGVFNWKEHPASRYYQVRVVSDDGDLLWQEQVDGTRWALPAELQLVAGAEYFLRVDAFVTESKSVSSDYYAFRVR